MSTHTAQQRAEEFLAQQQLFQLGLLPTESSHPQTRNLAQLALNDVPQAIKLLRKIDLEMLMKVPTFLSQLQPLAEAIRQTIESGRRIYICGCGATGRLALSLEYLWRTLNPQDADRVRAFMAGGDVALVHSLEGFEDFPEYGREQLKNLGFSEGDLLISSTEGGETPFVIGATEAAVEWSSRKPFFLYCNPKEILVKNVERSRRVLENSKIHSICLFVGPMALAGSTRMQASTILQLAIGCTLLNWSSVSEMNLLMGGWSDRYQALDVQTLAEFIVEESRLYQSEQRLMYQAEDLAITVFTDTTERSPTFSLPPFNNQKMPRPEHSLAYIQIPSAQSALDSWMKLLKREPRVLNWPERNQKTTFEYLSGFDFSQQALAYRKTVLPNCQHHLFAIDLLPSEMRWKLGHLQWSIPRHQKWLLLDHLLLKMLLNIHSTLVMGRLGRFKSNFMTYVTPTNGKLIDRATRYVRWLIENDGAVAPPTEVIVHELFRQLETLGDRESVVVKTAAALMKK